MQVCVHQSILVAVEGCNAITVRPQVNPVGSMAKCSFLMLCFGVRTGPAHQRSFLNTSTHFTFNWTPTITTYMPDAFHMVRPLATVSIDLLHFHFRLHLESDAIDETCECYRRTGSLTLRQIAIHSNFIVVVRVRSFESEFLEFRCLCRRFRHSSSNAFMLFLCKLQKVLTGRRSIVVKRIENIKIASPQIGA